MLLQIYRHVCSQIVLKITIIVWCKLLVMEFIEHFSDKNNPERFRRLLLSHNES